jgi:HTH-type transcriptional regulator / antitoxin HigA
MRSAVIEFIEHHVVMSGVTGNQRKIVKHPGHYIREAMKGREWLQRDLAFILGVPEQSVNLILSGKRNVSPEMALALAAAFDTSRDFFANLQQAYDLAVARPPDPKVAMRARMQSRYPVREMARRGWISASSHVPLDEQFMRLFDVPFADEIPYLAGSAHRGRYEERQVPPADLAWSFRVRQIAKSLPGPRYSEAALRGALVELEQLLLAPEHVRHVPRRLSDCGVRFIVVEKLPGANSDGVCLWLGPDAPAIGMTTRRDNIENFWFVLRHEVEHVLNGDGKNIEVIDRLDGEQASATNPSLSEQERRANAAAAGFCVPAATIDSFMVRHKPHYDEKDVLAFAATHRRHPGLIVAYLQKRMERPDYMARQLVKVRNFLLPHATVDGWGHVAPVSL